MSRRARSRAAAVAAKHVALVPLAAMTEPEDDTDDEGGIDARDDDPRCYVCGERSSVTDNGCAGHGGKCAECPRW